MPIRSHYVCPPEARSFLPLPAIGRVDPRGRQTPPARLGHSGSSGATASVKPLQFAVRRMPYEELLIPARLDRLEAVAMVK